MKKSDLKLDDMSLVSEFVGADELFNVKYDQCILVSHMDEELWGVHGDGSKWTIHPRQFNSVPHSIAVEYAGLEGYDLLSHSEAEKYIKMARTRAIDANKEVMEYNRKAKAWNENPKNRLKKAMKKWIKVEGNSPYSHFVESRKKRTKNKKK